MTDDPVLARLERVKLGTERTLQRVLDGGVFSGLVATSGEPSANRAAANAADVGDAGPGLGVPEKDDWQADLPVRRPGSANHIVPALGPSSPSEATLIVNVNLMGGTIFLDDERRTRALAKEIKRLITEDKRRGLTV